MKYPEEWKITFGMVFTGRIKARGVRKAIGSANVCASSPWRLASEIDTDTITVAYTVVDVNTTCNSMDKIMVKGLKDRRLRREREKNSKMLSVTEEL